ncbi:MAG: acyl-CoA-binding protein [Chloroflexi bacterium]|nr:MAG: acyl-CoA-binding protein [Chloroflexota bacterium]
MSAELQTRFEQAAAAAKNFTTRPDNDSLLQLYALYKQATSGDATGKRPGLFDVVGRAKFDAWAGQKGLGKETAMQQYIDLVGKLQK